MITISVKIKREDKEIMVKLLEQTNTIPVDLSNLTGIITYETYLEILSKLRATQHNDSRIRLNLVQTKFFLSFLPIYSFIGAYELANSFTLTKEIKQEIYKKKVKINH